MKYLLAFLLLCGSAFGQISPSLLDGETNSIATVDDAEREIHEGKMWHFSEIDTLDTTEVAQVITLTPATVEIGDIFTVTINGLSAAFACSAGADEAARVQNVVEGLDTELDNQLEDVWTDINWTEDNAKVIATSVTLGRGFELTLTTTDGGGADTQTFVQATTQANVPDKLEYLITTTSAKDAHLVFSATGQKITTLTFYRDCTRTGGIVKTAYNHNGASTETQTATLTAYPVGSGDGTAVFLDKWGIAAGTGATTTLGGGGTRNANEWIIEKSGAYLLVIEGITDADDVTVQLDWYETE